MIRRRAYLKRSGPPKRGKPAKARWKTKGGRHSDPAKLAWLRTKPCAASYCDGASCAGPVEAHHERRRGERATDRKAYPLCQAHHEHDASPHARHRVGPVRFAQFLGSPVEDASAAYEQAWQAHQGGSTF